MSGFAAGKQEHPTPDRRHVSADSPVKLVSFEPDSARGPAPPTETARQSLAAPRGPEPQPRQPAAWAYLVGLMLVLAGAVAASIPADRWGQWLAGAGEPLTAESLRWILAGVLVVAGISFLQSKPFFVLLTAGMIVLTAFTGDRIAGTRLSGWLNQVLGDGAAGRILPAASLGFAYLLHTAPKAAAPRVGGVFGLIVVALASWGTVEGWYAAFLEWVAPKVGPTASGFLVQWGDECNWAVALILTAVGVSASRTKPVHLMIAGLLVALAYHCVQTGYVRVEYFPSLDKSLETHAFRNVELWRWIVAGELVVLGLVLLHLALGLGGLSVAFASAWMILGLNLYHAVGTLSAFRLLDDMGGAHLRSSPAGRESALNPLANMGVPVSPSQPRSQAGAGANPGSAPPGLRQPDAGLGANSMARTPPDRRPSQTDARALAEGESTANRATVREVVPPIWMYLTAILAGIVAAAGLKLIATSVAYRVFTVILLWVGFAVLCVALAFVWQRDQDQSWMQWLAGFHLSRYHTYAMWAAFLGSLALAGSWSLLGGGTAHTWIHAGIYATFLGTILSLVGVALLIRFGGFPRLPVWTYVGLAAGQSSLAWVLLMHLSLSARSRPPPSPVLSARS